VRLSKRHGFHTAAVQAPYVESEEIGASPLRCPPAPFLSTLPCAPLSVSSAPDRPTSASSLHVAHPILQWLEILPEDDEKTRAKKKKLAKSYKSKIRFQNMDKATKERQKQWLNFQKGKGTKKKAGFETGAWRPLKPTETGYDIWSVVCLAGARRRTARATCTTQINTIH
jgi:hypothetical protein